MDKYFLLPHKQYMFTQYVWLGDKNEADMDEDFDFLVEYDSHGNVIRRQQNSGWWPTYNESDDLLYRKDDYERQRKAEETLRHFQEIEDRSIQETDDDVEVEIDMDEGGLREKDKEYNEDKEPVWTEVRGGASFYYICPRCGAFIPGTGPKIMGPDNFERLPKDQHEHWHKTRICDWYDD